MSQAKRFDLVEALTAIHEIAQDSHTVEWQRLQNIAATAHTALTALERDDWQDISTAPKDGTRVLAWHRGWETVHTAQWYGSYWGVFYKTGPLLYQPTHWMPLPAAPLVADQHDDEPDKDEVRVVNVGDELHQVLADALKSAQQGGGQ